MITIGKDTKVPLNDLDALVVDAVKKQTIINAAKIDAYEHFVNQVENAMAQLNSVRGSSTE